MLVIVVDEGRQFVFHQKVVQLALGLADPFKRAEALQVGTSHIGDEAAGGFCRLYQRLDVARMRGTHLHYGNVVLLVQSEQRLRHPDIVVEVALGGHHVVALRQYGTYQFLGSRLAVGTRNTDDGYVELPTVLACQVLEGLQTVLYYNHSVCKALLPFREVGEGFHNSIAATLLQCLKSKLVSIKRLTFQRQEDAALGTFARVRGDARMLLIQFV